MINRQSRALSESLVLSLLVRVSPFALCRCLAACYAIVEHYDFFVNACRTAVRAVVLSLSSPWTVRSTPEKGCYPRMIRGLQGVVRQSVFRSRCCHRKQSFWHVVGIEVCEHVGMHGVWLLSHSSTCKLTSHSGRCSIDALRQQEISSIPFRSQRRINGAQG